MDKKKEMSLVMRIKTYFGMNAVECREEYAELSEEDRVWFVKEFCSMGLPTIRKIAS